MLSLRILRIILIAGLVFLVSRKLLSKLSTQIDVNRYSKIRSSLDSNKLRLSYQILKNMNAQGYDHALDDILFKYIEQEWKTFLELPDGSSPKILNNRIESLLLLFPWSHNLKFFTQLLNLIIEFDQDIIPQNHLKSILHNSSFANKNKTIILINFCVRYDLNPFFLSSGLRKLNLENNDNLYLSFFEACLKNDIKGKELEFLKWFKELSELKIQKHLERWIKDSVTPLNKNSYILLIMMQQMDPILAKNYLKRKLAENVLPIEEIGILVQIKDKPSREILLVYLEELIQDLKRRKLYPEVQNIANTVLVRMSG